jgi:hypothetical protein
MQTPRRVLKYLDGAPAYVAAIYDNGGKSGDRYTVVYTAPLWTPDYSKANLRCGLDPYLLPARAMCEHPFSPQGIGLFVEARRGRHLGKLIYWKDLPADCQRCVIQDGKEDS